MNNMMIFRFKNIAYLAAFVLAHIAFTVRKNSLMEDLQSWWHEFVALATNYLSEDEINQRFSYVKGRPSLPFMKMDKDAFRDLTSQVTRGSIVFSPDLTTKTEKEEMDIRFSYPYIMFNQFQQRPSESLSTVSILK